MVLIRAGLAGMDTDRSGLVYRATERGPAFVDILEAPYVERLRERAVWAVHRWAPGMDVRAATYALVNSGSQTVPPTEEAL